MNADTATVLFQQPVHYNQTAAENISLGDIRRETDRPELESAAMAAGELLDSLKNHPQMAQISQNRSEKSVKSVDGSGGA